MDPQTQSGIRAGIIPLWAGTTPLWAGTIPLWAGTIPLWTGMIPLWAGIIPLWDGMEIQLEDRIPLRSALERNYSALDRNGKSTWESHSAPLRSRTESIPS